MASGGLALIFAVHAAGLLALALILMQVLPRVQGTARPAFDLKTELAAIYSTARIIAPGLIFIWHALAFIALLTYLPGALTGPAWVPVALPLVSLVGTFGTGFLARRIPPPRIAMAAFLANAFLCGAILLVPAMQVPLVCALFLVIGMAPAAGFASIPWLNMQTADRARANGALAQMGNVGTFSGTPLFALAAAAGGLTGILLLTLAIACAGAALAWWAARVRPA